MTVYARSFIRKSSVLLALTAILVANVNIADEVDQNLIAAGSAQWVSNSGDKSSTDAMVDIGPMRQMGDALKVIIRWPYLPASYGSDPRSFACCAAARKCADEAFTWPKPPKRTRWNTSKKPAKRTRTITGCSSRPANWSDSNTG
jgi:hypothetical protein